MAGSGTTLRAAKNLGRKAVGVEIHEDYLSIITERMAQIRHGHLAVDNLCHWWLSLREPNRRQGCDRIRTWRRGVNQHGDV